MGRPQGMKKVDGIWYMADGSLAASEIRKQQQLKDVKPVVTNSDPVVEDLIAEPVKLRPATRVHDREEIKSIEQKTGLVCSRRGIFDDCGILVPVFFNPERDADWIESRIDAMRNC